MALLSHELLLDASGKSHAPCSRKIAQCVCNEGRSLVYAGARRCRFSSSSGVKIPQLKNVLCRTTKVVPIPLQTRASMAEEHAEATKVSGPLQQLQSARTPPSWLRAGVDQNSVRVTVAQLMRAKEAAISSLSKVSVAAVAAALVLQQGSALALLPMFNLDNSSMQRTLEEAWTIVHETYVDPTFNEQDWDSKFKETFDQLAANTIVQSLPPTDADSLQLKAVGDDVPESAGGSLPLKTMPEDDANIAGYKKISGMLETLGDPFTRIITPSEYENFRVRNNGSLQGVGMMIAVQKDSGRVLVLYSVEGSPAARAGILPGDELVQINNEQLVDLKTDDAAGKLRGKAGTTVTVKLARKSPSETGNVEVLKEITLRREEIHLSPVTTAVLNYTPEDQVARKLGYIRLNSFPMTASYDMEAAIRSLDEKDKVDGFILDLRDNPGGLVKAGLDIAEMWLDGDDVLVNTIDREGTVRAINMTKNHALTKDPLVVLVNENSASASEILAAALHDNGRAVLVGSKTYGKGKIQSVSQLSDGSALFVTVAKYVSPALHPIDKVGIEPDVLCSPEPVKEEPAATIEEAKAKMLDRVMTWNSKEKLPAFLQHDSCVLVAERQLDGKLTSRPHSNS